MMHIYHLLWIIPAAACFGFIWAAMLAASREK